MMLKAKCQRIMIDENSRFRLKSSLEGSMLYQILLFVQPQTGGTPNQLLETISWHRESNNHMRIACSPFPPKAALATWNCLILHNYPLTYLKTRHHLASARRALKEMMRVGCRSPTVGSVVAIFCVLDRSYRSEPLSTVEYLQ
jgi:hypothetical protein